MIPQAEFAQGRTIIWLASYPKSGSTWLRALLTACLCPDDALDLNRLLGGPVVFERALLDDHAAIDSAHRSIDELLPYQSLFHQAFASAHDGPIFVKTHSAFRSAASGVALFPREASAGAIVIVRNPLDIVASYAHHEGKPTDAIVRRMADAEATQDAWQDRASKALPQRIGGWSGNVASWIDQAALPVCLVRYEDMLADTYGALERVLRFCGLAIDPSVVRRAVEICAFARLADAETRAGFVEKPSQSRPFFRAGGAGSGMRELTGSQAADVIAGHGPTMERLGYKI